MAVYYRGRTAFGETTGGDFIAFGQSHSGQQCEGCICVVADYTVYHSALNKLVA